jgi:hypothetical protein
VYVSEKWAKKAFTFSVDALVDPHKFQVTMISLARFENKKIFYSTLKNVIIVFYKKSFETVCGAGAHQLLKTVVFSPKTILFDF